MIRPLTTTTITAAQTLTLVRALVVALLACALLAPVAAFAQEERATVRLDGRAVFRVGATDTADPSVRARQIERRLATLLQSPTAIAPPQIEPSGTDPASRVISVAGVPIVTVTPQDAQDNVTTVDALGTQWASALDGALQRAAGRRLGPGGRFVAEVQAAITGTFARLLESAITVIPRVLAALLVLALFWALASAVRWAMRLLFRRFVDDLTVENLIKQVAYYAVWILGLLLAADALGFEAQTVVTGLGLTSLALGFALKDILANFVSGLLILALRPFRIGDQIVVGETEGSVERIDLRATQMRTYDGRLVLVPNAELFTSRVTNNTASPVRRGNVELFIGYEADLQEVARTLQAAAGAAPGVLPDPPPSVRVRELGQDDVVVEVRFWTDSRRSDFLATASEVRRVTVAALRAAGIGLPDPDVRFLVPRDADRWQEAMGGPGAAGRRRSPDSGPTADGRGRDTAPQAMPRPPLEE